MKPPLEIAVGSIARQNVSLLTLLVVASGMFACVARFAKRGEGDRVVALAARYLLFAFL